jgi:hypothetical protein
VAFLRARLSEDEAVAKDWPDEMDVRWYKVPTYTPERVLREVEAKRAILSRYQSAVDHEDDWYITGTLDGVLHLLAAVYRDHPDYDPDWAP